MSMARISGAAKRPAVRITKFLGLNEAEGAGQLKLGESPRMTNFVVTMDGNLEKRCSIEDAQIGTGDWRRHWTVRVGGEDIVFAQCSDPAANFWYRDDVSVWTHPDGLSHVTGGANLWAWRDAAYGDTVRVWPEYQVPSFLEGGSMTAHVLAPYLPVAATATPPAGGGTDLEPLNLLTQGYRQRFSGNGSTKTFVMRTTLPSGYSIRVFVDGAEKLASDATFPWSWSTKTLTFTGAAAPANATNNVEIWQSPSSGACDAGTVISQCTGSVIYGGAADTRVWVWGESDHPGRLYYSGIDEWGMPNDAYWPTTSYVDVPDEITDCVRLYDRLIIFSGARAFYATYSPFTDAQGNLIPDYPVLPLNDTVGQMARGQTLLIKNCPVTIGPDGIYKWVSTNVRDERNAVRISDRVATSFRSGISSLITTLEWPERSEAWFGIGPFLLVWNYQTDVWYKLEFPNGIVDLCMIDKEPHLCLGAWGSGVCVRYGAPSGWLDLGQYEQELEWWSDEMDFGRPSEWKFLDRLWLDSYSTASSSIGGYLVLDAIGMGDEVTMQGEFTSQGYRQLPFSFLKTKWRRLRVRLSKRSHDDLRISGIDIAAHVSGGINTLPQSAAGPTYPPPM